MTYERLCRRGERCAARHDYNGPAPTDRPICDRDTEELSRVLREFEELLVQLHLMKLAALAGSGLAERVSGGAVEAPLLFDVNVDELANTVVGTVVEWATAVAQVAGAPVPPPGHHLAGRALRIAVGTLRPRLSVLLALQPRVVERAGEAFTMDGGAAAIEIFDLHHRCRAVLGRTRKIVHLPQPCPADGCGVRALCRYDGHDEIRCNACGTEMTLDELDNRESA